MRKLWLFFLLLVPMFFLSCDPSRRIEMKNNTNDTAEVTWKSIEDSIGFNPFVLNNKKELTFVLPPRKNSEVKLSFGTGTWSPEEVQKAIHLLEYFQIKSANGTLRIDSLPQLKDYLLSRRQGIGKSKIVIVIDE